MSEKNIIYERDNHQKTCRKILEHFRRETNQEQEGSEEENSPKAEKQRSSSCGIPGEKRICSQNQRRSTGGLTRGKEVLRRDDSQTNQKTPSRMRLEKLPREVSEPGFLKPFFTCKKVPNIRELGWQELNRDKKLLRTLTTDHNDWLRQKLSGLEKMSQTSKLYRTEKTPARQKLNRNSEQRSRPEIREPSNHRSNRQAELLKQGTRGKQNKEYRIQERVGQEDAMQRQHLNEIKKAIKLNREISKTKSLIRKCLSPGKFSKEVDYLRQRTENYYQAFLNDVKFNEEIEHMTHRTQYFYQLFLNAQLSNRETRPSTHRKKKQNQEGFGREQPNSERRHSTQIKQKKNQKHLGGEKLNLEKKSLKKKFDLIV